jgi:hypothetical protein
MRLAEKAAER